LLSAPPGVDVDHINRNGLDNRKTNLRLCEGWQNALNKSVRRDNRSGYKGVSRYYCKWKATVAVSGKHFYLGLFDTPKEAADAYDKAATELHGRFACLNAGGQHAS
jgi:hypothetical protein